MARGWATPELRPHGQAPLDSGPPRLLALTNICSCRGKHQAAQPTVRQGLVSSSLVAGQQWDCQGLSRLGGDPLLVCEQTINGLGNFGVACDAAHIT